MPTIDFKGKEFVFNHHLSVPFRPLIADPGRSIGAGSLDGNLIIHGDNLHALKALLPRYAGKVDCIFIDPPYNTGNEGWCYSDNVNSLYIREWLSKTPINVDDGLRHDKWLCMMWPRLRLLRELLSDRGSLWMTLDDNEIHRARAILDEIFGEENFVATCIWQKVFSPKNSAQFFSEDHDYVLVYAKVKEVWRPNLLQRTPEMEARYSNPDNDLRGAWTSGDLSARNYYSEGTYPITCPSGRIISGPPRGMYWRVSQRKFRQMDKGGRIWWGADGNNQPRIKRYLSEVKPGLVPQTIWGYEEVGHTQDAKKELLAILDFKSSDEVFVTPKPVRLVERVLELATDENSIVLDSFAGSGTTGHAVLLANSKDGGNRRFIMVECEEYADTLTAERMRRVISGYSFKGVQRRELLREKFNVSSLKKADEVLRRVDTVENLEGHNFDEISKEVKDGELIVTGERRITDRTEGLPGGFTYCTLGDALDLDKMLLGEQLPDYSTLGTWLFHTATGLPLDPSSIREPERLLGEAGGRRIWLHYKPDLEWLKSPSAALTLEMAERLARENPDSSHLIFAAAKFVANKDLHTLGVQFAPLPFSLYRLQTDQG